MSEIVKDSLLAYCDETMLVNFDLVSDQRLIQGFANGAQDVKFIDGFWSASNASI